MGTSFGNMLNERRVPYRIYSGYVSKGGLGNEKSTSHFPFSFNDCSGM
jgi:hypothetical protein